MLKSVFSRVGKLLLATFFIIFLFVAIFPTSTLAATGILKQINFQGKVVNSDGTNVSDASYNFLFCLYTTASPTTPCTAGADNDAVWRESKSVSVTDGVFRTSLGDTTTLPGSVDFNTDNIYLGVNFNSDGQMTPLIRFTAVPYAFNADKIHGLTVSDTTGTFTLTNGKTLTVNNTLTLAGSDSTTITFQGTDTYVGRTTTDTLTNKTLTAPKFADLGYLADSNGDELLILDTVSTPVNEITISNAGTGAAPTIIASGETNVGLTINSKAAGALTLDSGTTGTVNLGTGNNAKTIAIGTGTAGNTLNIGTDNTTADTINIGSALDNVAITGDQWSITNAGVLTVASCTGCGGGGGTLQEAYDAGNTITTDATGDITITLAELGTPTRFEIFNQDTAGSEALEIDNTIASGTLTNGLLIEQSGAGTMTNAINIAGTAGTIANGILIADGSGAITDGIEFTGTMTNFINTPTIDITGAGAITGATGITVASGGVTITSGALAVNSDSITSDGALVINATSTDIQDAVTVDSLTTDTGGVSIAAGQSYTGAGAVTVSSTTTNALTLDSGTTGGVNLGTGNNAKTISIATGTAGNTINIGTDNTTKDTLTIGSALDDVAISSDSWSVTNAGVLTVASCTGCGGGGVSDGDKGDITVASSGTVWTVDFTSTDGSGSTSSASGLEAGTGGIGLLQGCSDEQILKWDDTSGVWECGTDRASYVHRLGGNYTNTTASLTDVDNNSDASDDMDLPVGANETWIFWMNVQYVSPSTSDGKWAMTAPSGASCSIGYSDLEGAVSVANDECDGVATGSIASSGGADSFIVNGTIVNGANSGSMQLQFQQNSAGGTSTIYAGSSVFGFKVTGADLAETYYTMDNGVVPGTLVSLDPSIEAGVKKSARAYDKDLIGVITTQPGLILGEVLPNSQGHPVNVALTGRVPVKVSTENGPIHPGDLLTASSTPGVAMRATKAGTIIGQAMIGFEGEGTGTIAVFLKTGYANGTGLASLMNKLGLEEPGVENQEVLVLKHLLENKESPTAGDLSEVFTDKVAAGIEIITPKVITGTVMLDNLKSATGSDINLNLNSDGTFKVKDEEGKDVITFDDKGNAYFAGLIVADKIKANQIEGFEILTNKISSLSSALGTKSSSSSPNLDLSSQSDGLTNFDVNVTFKGESVFEKLVTLLANVVFKGEVSFEKAPTFNKDTAGLAKIKYGQRFVFVEFSEEYKNEPIVNATLYIPRLTQELYEQKIVSGDCVVPMSKEECEGKLANDLFANDIRFAVTAKTNKGFVLVLNKSATQDTVFSWSALAVQNPQTAEKQGDFQLFDFPVEAKDAPTITSTPTLSPPPQVIFSTPTPEASPEATL